MSKYNLKFKKREEKRFLYLPITATEKEEAIKEAKDFIWKRGNIEEAYIEEIIHKTQKIWDYKETEIIEENYNHIPRLD